MKVKRVTLMLLLLLFMVSFARVGHIEAEASGRYTIYVNRKTNIVNVVNRSTGKVVRSMYCSTGKGYSTISGTYHTISRLRWHALYHGVWGQYCTRIHGPYLFHSVWYYRTRNNQVSTREYNKLGSQASAGCVRLAVIDAKWIFDHCGVGTKVVIGERRKLQRPTRGKIKISTASDRGWDPTDPNPNNPYYPKIALKKSASKTIAYGSDFDPLKLISVKSKTTSSKRLIKNVTVKGKVKTKKPGKYKLTYTVRDPRTLLKKSLTVTFKVAKKPVTEVAE